jgi:hypothetical protein
LVVTPEVRAALHRLAELGFIEMKTNAAKRVFDTGAGEPPALADHVRRCARARTVLDAAERQMKMADVLAAGLQARKPRRQRVKGCFARLVPLVLFFAADSEVDRELDPLTDEMVAAVCGRCGNRTHRTRGAILQAAHLGLEAESRTA